MTDNNIVVYNVSIIKKLFYGERVLRMYIDILPVYFRVYIRYKCTQVNVQ